MGIGSLTEKQLKVLKFIADQIRARGRPPTLREICAQFRYASLNAAQTHLDALERKGFVRLVGGKRGIELVQRKFWELFGVPVIGRVAAGSPIDAIENYEGTLGPDDVFPQGERIFALRVKGDSMKDAGILQGDLVFVQRQEEAQSGQIVVAIKDEEVTLKSLVQERGKRYLQPANPRYKREELDGWRIVGVVIEVVRKLRY